MITFLPQPDFSESARILDDRRLGKQRVEAYQILLALLEEGPWSNHPAVKMWKGFEYSLCLYTLACCSEWRKRGFDDSISDKIEALMSGLKCKIPPWFGDPKLHASHRSNLMRKDPVYRLLYKWTEPNNLPYYWPKGSEI